MLKKVFYYSINIVIVFLGSIVNWCFEKIGIILL